VTPPKGSVGFGGDQMGIEPWQTGGGQGDQPDLNLGGDMFPWLQRWTGGFQAPTSPWENQALEGMGNFVGGGMGLDDSREYLGGILKGNMLDPNNKYFDEIQKNGQVLKDMEDQRAMRELQSRASAGGNALSGALMGAEGDYMRGSNASFNQMMAQLRADQYARERGYQQQAPGMANDLSRTEMGGYGQLMDQGQVPRNIQTGEMQGQYADWLRQIQGLQGAYQYPDQMGMAMLNQGNYRGYQTPQYGDSGFAQLMALFPMIFGESGAGGVDWGSIINGVGGLFGGGGEGGGGEGDGADQVNPDGHRYYDAGGVSAAASAPRSYRDNPFYQNALTMEQNKAKQPQMMGQGNGVPGAVGGTAALLMQILKMLAPKDKKKSNNQFKPGVGGGGGGKEGTNGKNRSSGKADPNAYDKPIGPGLNPGEGDFPNGYSDMYDEPIGPEQPFDEPYDPEAEGGFDNYNFGDNNDWSDLNDFGLGDWGGLDTGGFDPEAEGGFDNYDFGSGNDWSDVGSSDFGGDYY
jgi:hypothetical protein